MRISDWSSVVCSSDLVEPAKNSIGSRAALEDLAGDWIEMKPGALRVCEPHTDHRQRAVATIGVARVVVIVVRRQWRGFGDRGAGKQSRCTDRKRDVRGERVAGRVDRGGGGIIK